MRLANDPLLAACHIVTPVQCIVLPVCTTEKTSQRTYELLLRRCTEKERGRRRERERESGERRNGGAKRARSLRGSVGNSGRRRVVNFRLHRRAASRLPPWSTFLFFFLLAPFLRPWNVLPHALPSYSSRAYDSASLRLNAYADCR